MARFVLPSDSEGDIVKTAGSLNRTSALVVPRELRDTITVSGEDRRSWLNGLLTCDLKEVGPGQGCWGLLLNRQGRIQSDVDVVSAPDSILLGVGPQRGPAIRAFLEGYLVMDDVELDDTTEGHAWIGIHGPLAVAVASEVVDGQRGSSARLDWTGLGGAALVVPREDVRRVLESLVRIGRGAVTIGTDDDWNRVRIECGLPAFGVDYSVEDNPHDASLEQRAVSWTKGCYLGQEVVCMQGMRGKTKRRIAPIVVDGDALPEVGDELSLVDGDDGIVGKVTSAAMSLALGRAVALARVGAHHGVPGTLLRAAKYVATVVASPTGVG